MSTNPMTLPINPTPADSTSFAPSEADLKKGSAGYSELASGPGAMPPAATFIAPAAFPALHVSASLYVGELHPEVNEAMLYELFNQVGPVASVRVCRDAITRRSLGYAYVNFHNQADGERALDALNYHPLKGVPIRIMWSQRDPSLRRSGSGNVFIKNLEKSIDNKALHDTFSAFGNILSCKVVCDEHGNSRGFGFVHFETQEAADQAIEKVNGMLLNDVQVYVGQYIPRRERASKVDEAKARFTNVYVKNLDESVSDEELREAFSKFGEVTSVLVQKDAVTGQSRGFGFVNFATHRAAADAVDSLNETELNGKKLLVCRAQSKAEREEELKRQYEAAKLERISKFQGVNLYLKNLEESVNEDMLRTLFEPFGTVTSCKVMRDEKDISRGFGFICFSQPEEAQKALGEMNGKMVKEKPLFVAFAQRKEDRHSLLEAQYHQRLQYRSLMAQQNPLGMPSMYPPAMYGRPPMMPGAMIPRRFLGGGQQYQHQHQHQQHQQPQQSNVDGMPAGGVSGAPGINGMPQRYGYGPRDPMSGSGGGGFRGGRGGFISRGAGGMPGMMQAGPNGAFLPRRPQGGAFGNNMMGSHYRGGHHSGGMGHRRFGGAPMSHQGNPNPNNGGEFYSAAGSFGAAGLTAAYLAGLPSESQKQLLGERLFPIVATREPVLATKITGMLLEFDNSELLHLLESPETLASKISEAALAASAASATASVSGGEPAAAQESV